MDPANRQNEYLSFSAPYSGKYATLSNDHAPPRAQVNNFNKRPRFSSGASETSPPLQTNEKYELFNKHYNIAPTKENFKKMNSDEKLCCMFDILGNLAPLAYRLDTLERDMFFSSAIHDVNTTRIRLLEYKSIDIEARSKQNNLIFSGLDESVLADDCRDIVQIFLNEQLNIDRGNYDITKAYRIGRKSFSKTNKTIKNRSILVSFIDPRQVDLIMSQAYLLKGTFYGISKDYPKEISDARKELWPEYKQARAKYGPKNVTIKYPASLVIRGETVRNKFPDWYEVLQGSRNSNINERIDIRFKAKVQEFTEKTMNEITKNDIQTDGDDYSSDESDMEVTMHKIQETNTPSRANSPNPTNNTMATAPHRSLFSSNKKSAEKIKRPAPSKPNQTHPESPNQSQPRQLSVFTPSEQSHDDQVDRPPDTDTADNANPHTQAS